GTKWSGRVKKHSSSCRHQPSQRKKHVRKFPGGIKMHVTIIRDDSLVGIDGQFRQVDLSGLPDGIRAVQWNGTGGHVEYDEAPNTVLDHITGFQPFVELWEAAAPRAASL